MSKMKENQKAAWLFCAFGTAAIITGGGLAAFSAADPSRLALWLSAYLVLVVGVIQVGIGAAMAGLAVKQTPRAQHLATFLLFNAGAAAVMTGTIVKGVAPHSELLINMGSIVFVVALALCLYAIRGAKKSWWRMGYIVLVLLAGIGALTGVVLAQII
jgi:ABC-type multidrug transport system permease subunit